MLRLRQIGNLRHSRKAPYGTLVPTDDVTVNYKHGLPVITLTLPSRKERCQFTIKPMRMTVGDFLQDIHREDKAVEKVEVFTADCVSSRVGREKRPLYVVSSSNQKPSMNLGDRIPIGKCQYGFACSAVGSCDRCTGKPAKFQASSQMFCQSHHRAKDNIDGSMISASTLMEILLMNDFKLAINGAEYSIHPPLKDKMSGEHTAEMDDIKSMVHKLFTALHLEDHQRRKERELMQRLELLKEQLLPLEQMKTGIYADANVKTSRFLWIGLALLSTQGGALAWLTWWVYSWDIMEPVTYFITYGSAMAFYAYFVLTKQDYIYPEARDRQFLNYFHQKSKGQRFNVDQYNKLKEDVAEVEESLKRLRNPLQLRLPLEEINGKD